MVLPSRNKRRWLVLGAIGAGVLLFGCVPGAPDDDLPSGPELEFSITVAWNAVTEDADGNEITDLAAYRLYFSRTTPVEPDVAEQLDAGLETMVTVEGLVPGAWFFAVAAIDSSGNQSELSDELSAEVGPE